ncbi:MAG TPA: tRNA pseudouridine(38-40) synthase TruA, partial [Vicinamibacterales bacterium]|nr:tRNA pseudouridine(38-40) synthase TruA [Vicinamibacterales bacterium]
NGPTIQAALEDALRPFVDRPTVFGAGRTDSGVHALGQVASVQIGTEHSVDVMRRALNVSLDRDIRVLQVADAPEGFNARFDAVGKTYRYRIVTSEVVSPFAHRYVWHLPQPLDVAAMQAATPALLGRHDFSAFMSTGSDVLDTVRTLDRADLHVNGDELVFEVHGDGFLRHMVRAIVGTLVDVGTGRRDPATVRALVDSRDRGHAGDTAPAQGLTLVSVEYP